MTDKKAFYQYRIKQAQETLSDAEKMLKNHLSSRSIINRAYYSLFYAILALYINEGLNLKTSKHSGVISIFDKEFVHSGKIDKNFSKILQRNRHRSMPCEVANAQISLPENIFNKLISHYICQYRR